MVFSPSGHAVGVLAVQISSVHHRMPDRGGQWGIAVFVLGVVLICHGVAPLVRARRWRARASWAPGRVIDHVSAPPAGGPETCSPIIEFDAGGATVRFRSRSTGSAGTFPLGSPVEVLYDPVDPRRAGLPHTGWADTGWADTGWPISWSLVLGIAVLGVFSAVVAA